MSNAYLNALGIVCSLGTSRDEVAANLFAGSTQGVVRLEDVVPGASLPFAPVADPLPGIPTHLHTMASRNVQLAFAALGQIDDAIQQAISNFGTARIAVVMGSSTSGIRQGELAVRRLVRDGEFPPDYSFLQQELGTVSESIAIHYGLAAPALTVSTACTSSAGALASARRMLAMGIADAVITGGCDSFCQMTLGGFFALSALSESACLPFSRNRNGTMIGEGAAVFLMSRTPGGPRLAGVGESADAHNMTAPHPDGLGAVAAMQAALADAGCAASDIDYVNLHGTATALNDAMESRAISRIFPHGVPCSSSKAQCGHTLGAASAIEAALCWLALEENPQRVLPPHVWDGEQDPEAPLAGRVTPSDRLPDSNACRVMTNSYAFGGSNASLILERVTG